MDVKRHMSSFKPKTASNGSFGFGATRQRRQDRDAATESTRPCFTPWRVFINHIDSYHGKILADILSNTVYVDPQDTRATPPHAQNEEFENEDNENTKQEEEEEEQREKRKRSGKNAKVSRKYEVIGTVLDCEYLCPEDVRVIKGYSDDRATLLSELTNCGIVIYDITREMNQIEEACWALKEIVRAAESVATARSPKMPQRATPVRHFVLISSLMTWAHAKSADPLTEADYRKRKPHPSYKEHIRCEREVVTVKKLAHLKRNLRTLVLCCGVTYGEEEGPLHFLFKMAWLNAPFLPIFNGGRNRIPLLHVRDLAAIVSMALRDWPPIRYIVAAEQELITQSTIIKKISRELTTGKVRNVSKEEALLLPDVSQDAYDQMTADLNIHPVYILNRIRWHLDMSFRHSVEAIVEEYKAARNLRPVKIIVLGPPVSGKTRVARYLAKHYGIHYIHVQSLISDAIQKLIKEIEVAASGEENLKDIKNDEDKMDREKEVREEEEEMIASVAELQEQLDEIRANLAANNGRLDDIVLNKLFLYRLKSKDCLNQGYVMDGYPKTLEQAKKLFLIGEENLEDETEQGKFEDEDAEMRNVNMAILPELVVVLEASDEFLKERVMNLPEKEIQNTHYTEEHMLRRLKEYRERNTNENTPLQLFDEIEIHPLVVSVESDACPHMFPTVYRCLEKLGKPRNYGPTKEEIEAERKRAEAEVRAAEIAEKLREEREFSERKRQREEKMMEWTNLMEKLKEEEEEKLCVLAEPLRLYLAKHVFPTLTEALIEVAKLRPEDPLDFLAEYLFQRNPEGRMFEPDYTETMSMLLDAIGRQRNDVLPGEGLEADLEQLLRRRDELSTADAIDGSGARDERTDGFEKEQQNLADEIEDDP